MARASMTDLLVFVSDWDLSDSPADVAGSGTVDMPNLLAVIGAWGECE